jgi:hypothetical protein
MLVSWSLPSTAEEKKRPGEPGVGGVRRNQTMPALHHGGAQQREFVVDELVERRAAQHGGVQLFFSIASAQDLDLMAFITASVSAARSGR